MSRHFLLTAPLLLVAACGPSEPGPNGSVDINAAATQAQEAVDAYGANVADDAPVAIAEPDAANNLAERNTTALSPLDPPAPGTPGGLADDRTPLSEAPFTADSAQGGANVVQTYYALIGEGKYAQAWALRDAGAAGALTAAEFAASFARYSEYHANIGAPGAVDAGAGQRNLSVPVQVYARLKQGGTPFYQVGSVVLHRTEMDGATEDQRRWRIRRIDLKRTPER